MTAEREWWNSRWFICAAVALSVLPLLWPAFPPLNDVPAHIGRYHVALEIVHSPYLQRHWTYHWALVGNLGVDLLVFALGQALSAMLAAKLIIMAIPPLTIAGWLWLSREVDGRVSPLAGFAFALTYAYPFQMGFVNFALAAALAILALALWLRLARQRRFWLRLILFAPISWALWICHSFGWGLFGLFAFAAEVTRLRRAGASWLRSLIEGAAWSLALATPVVAMIAGGDGGVGLGWSWEPVAKLVWLAWLLNERWLWWDIAGALTIYVMLYVAIRRSDLCFQPLLLTLSLVSAAAFLALPKLLLGGGYVDVRMLPIALALALLAVRPRDPDGRLVRGLAVAGALFFVARMLGTTVALALFSQAQAKVLEAVPHIPRGVGVLVLADRPCPTNWSMGRMEHVASIALAERDVFDNGEWTIAGQQLLRDRHPEAKPFTADPSQFVDRPECRIHPTTLPAAMRAFNRSTFQYVWTIDLPPRAALASDVHAVWSNGASTLYRVGSARR